MKPPLPRLHAITDERVARRSDVVAVAGALAGAGGVAVALHARGAQMSGREHFTLASQFSRLAAQVFVNDRLDVALAVHAGGVQLGRGSLPPAEARRLNAGWWIGRSVHSIDEARAAKAQGADYLLAGPVYATATHAAATPLGVEWLAEIAGVGLPVIAIGGVTPARVRDLRKAGAHGVAAIRALWDATDPARAAQEMLMAMDDT
ncbi:MAG: thiamine phosphate synthase [Gemmatimonadales bacterium]